MRPRKTQILSKKSGWHQFFALLSSSGGETEFARVVGDVVGDVRQRRILMLASPRRRAHCKRNEPRAGIDALVTCCLVRLSSGGVGLPRELQTPCTQQMFCRGASLASRLNLLAFAGDKRGRSKALLLAVLDGSPFTHPAPASFASDPDLWAHGQTFPKTSAKKSSRHTGRDRAALRLSFPRELLKIFAILETLICPVTTPHYLLRVASSVVHVYEECYDAVGMRTPNLVDGPTICFQSVCRHES